MNKKYITMKDLKERYHMGNDKVSLLMHMPKFPTLKIKGRYYVDLEMLEELERKAIELNCDLFKVIA